ncbi:hypothetical protein MMC25_001158 [Agyrium rufum]|nr:hypothetical protein [Agyrium rufum]
MAVLQRIRPYREFLTAVLHRRFIAAAGCALLTCYADALLIRAQISLFWSWFPLGKVSITTSFLFISALLVFILRVSQNHIGQRLYPSPLATIRQHASSYHTVQTIAIYSFSALLYSEIYMWSVPATAELHWIAEGKYYERSHLNDRPIFLRTTHQLHALCQAALHLVGDYDALSLPIDNPPQAPMQAQAYSQTPALHLLAKALPRRLERCARRAIIISFGAPFLYGLFGGRYLMWKMHLVLARIVWNVPQSVDFFAYPPFHITLFLRSLTSGLFLIALWEISSLVLNVYWALPPIKVDKVQGDKFLTDDSADPNGSLLNGLNAKRRTAKAFAFWELKLLSQHSEIRRKAIYNGIDRAGGTTWSQILNLCLAEIKAPVGSIEAFRTGNKVANPLDPPANPPTLEFLPRISAPLKTDPILTNSPPPKTNQEWASYKTAELARSYGTHPNSSSPSSASVSTLSPRAQKYLKLARDKLLTPDQQNVLSHGREAVTANVNDFTRTVLETPWLGWFFRQTFARRLKNVVLRDATSHFSNLGIIINAIDAVTALAIASLKEDELGTVSKDIKDIMRLFVEAIENVEVFTMELSPHWTDVKFDAERPASRYVEEVALLVRHLRMGLREMVAAFRSLALDLGISSGEMRRAKALLIEAPKGEEVKKKNGGGEKRVEGREQENLERDQGRIGRADKGMGKAVERPFKMSLVMQQDS